MQPKHINRMAMTYVPNSLSCTFPAIYVIERLDQGQPFSEQSWSHL